MLCLYLQAPFATFRTFTAGSFRPTADFITPSAAYGLLLNVAGIEMREVSDKHPMTLVRCGLPRFRLAIGALGDMPRQHTVYQQLHNYPVGNSGEAREESAKGSKYNITPVRRAFLSDVRAYLCVDGDPEVETNVLDGLAGRMARAYGLPFLGDSNFLLDRLEPVAPADLHPARWLARVAPEAEGHWGSAVTRLTIAIDRANMSQTTSALFAPSELTTDIPAAAWTDVGY